MKEFKEFEKIARLNREIVITEKIDGTNAQITITEDGQFLTGSRTRWITPMDDNYGFAAWALTNKDELMKLGVGSHFGEWWGSGCQRGYGLPKGEKRFSLFNTGRWDDLTKPSCCHVVPQLYVGNFSESAILGCLDGLRKNGSVASTGFMKPEGIIIYHTAARQSFKVTLEKDEMPKSFVKPSDN
jgi:hypothetical protein